MNDANSDMAVGGKIVDQTVAMRAYKKTRDRSAGDASTEMPELAKVDVADAIQYGIHCGGKCSYEDPAPEFTDMLKQRDPKKHGIEITSDENDT